MCDGNGILVYRLFEQKDDKDKFVEEVGLPCACKGEREQADRRDVSDIPKTYENATINNFNINFYSSRDIAINVRTTAKNFIKNFDEIKNNGKGLYLYSKTKGSGKTYLACAMGNALISQHNIGVKFASTIELLQKIKDSYRKDSEMSERDLLRIYKTVPVLILDDIGAENKTAWVDNVFLNILDTRISENLITFFTSNVPIEKLTLDERIVNRIYKMAIEVPLPEESVRKNLAQMENKELMQLLGGRK